MTYLPGFENDVFISYTHKDNKYSSEGDNGWVSHFHRVLQMRLTELLGMEAKIWRDMKLSGADNFNDEIFAQLRNSAVFIPIVSPGYISSSYCQHELEEFQNAAKTKGGIQVGTLLRAIKIVKTPLQGNKHRDILLASSLGYEFYAQDPDTAFFDEFEPGTGNFNRLLNRLAQDIKRVLEAMKSPSPHKGTVYLAETSADLKADRQKLVDELQAQGYQVLPDGPLPEHAADIRQCVQADLEVSKMAIQLAGPRYGKRPEGTDHSIVALQYEIIQNSGIPCVFWIAKRMEAIEPLQIEFLQSLREHVTQGMDLLENKTLEDLKDVITARLDPHRQSKPMAKSIDNGLMRIYLICDQVDHPLDQNTAEQNWALALRDYLFEAGFEVKWPVSLNTAAASRQKDNKEKLKQCDAVLLYWGRTSQAWLDERMTELNKALGWRRAKPFAAKAVYVTVPEDNAKRLFKTHEAQVITQFGPFSPEPLMQFLTDLRGKRNLEAA